MSLAPPLSGLSELTGRAWVVGGAIRDGMLGRATEDFDVIVDGDVRRVARGLARERDAHSFPLSEAFGAWRVVAKDRSWQVDLTSMVGDNLEEDLGRRDLTINAMARAVGDTQLIDPFGGRADLQARRLRMVSDQAFREDPLRVMRLSRLGAELDFAIDPVTLAAAVTAAPGLAGVAGERIFAELRQIVGGERPIAGLGVLQDSGAAALVLPELLALRGVRQSDYHHLDVHDHTLQVLDEVVGLASDPSRLFPDLADQVRRVLGEPLADELTRGQALRFGALFHDLAKSMTRQVNGEGRVTFMGHDQAGAELATQIFSRLRASERLASHVSALTRHHLRLGFLVHEMPVSRLHIYRYLRTCEPVEVDVTLLSVADRLATRGRNAETAIRRHLELAAQMLAEALRWREQPPRPPVRGDRLADALEIAPGPELGRLLEALTEAAFAGEVHDDHEALEWARRRQPATRPGSQRIARLPGSE